MLNIPAALAACAALVLSAVPAASAATPVLPSGDPFYTYRGSAPLASVKPGTVLDKRAVSVSLNIASTPVGVSVPGGPVQLIPAEQLLYRTTDELGQPSVTVTTVLVPPTVVAPATVAPNIVDYNSFYDSLSTKCDPSYTLTGGDPGANNTELSDAEQLLVAESYAAGEVVTIPDFEGTSKVLHWVAGHESGYGALDGIRATESYLGAPATSKVVITGYSGGAIASDWASELAPAYAPELNLVGTDMGGLVVDIAHNVYYVSGSQSWSGVMDAVLYSLSNAFGIDFPKYASDYGLKVALQDAQECIGDFSGTTPGLTIDKLLKPEYAKILEVPEFAKVMNSLIMGSAPGHPSMPLFIGAGNDPGNAQGQGDDVMLTADQQALAHEYCSEGVPVQFQLYSNTAHTQAGIEFLEQGQAFAAERFAGTPPTDDCASIPVGASLAPLPIIQKASTKPATSTKPTTKVSKPKTTHVSAPSRSLAATGSTPLAAFGALLLITTGGVLLRRRRA